MSSSGPGLWLSWLAKESASRALFSWFCRSISEGSTSGRTSSKICLLTSSDRSGLEAIFALSMSPILARSSLVTCSCKEGEVLYSGMMPCSTKMSRGRRTISFTFSAKRRNCQSQKGCNAQPVEIITARNPVSDPTAIKQFVFGQQNNQLLISMTWCSRLINDQKS